MKLRHAIEVVRRFGPGWALYRARYALRQKTGLLRRKFPSPQHTELRDWVPGDVPTEPTEFKQYHEQCGGRFFFVPGELPDRAVLDRIVTARDRDRTIDVADDFCHGRFLYFSDQTYDLGWPPNWLFNPIVRAQHECTTHWCDYPTFSPSLGDVKEVWEPSRFACAYWLSRAYALTGDERYPAAFWMLFESWCQQNPINRGPNWKCGQEIGLRVFAWCFALHAFWKSPVTTPERVAAMAVMLAAQAERINHNIDFAISQENNHSMSEAAGLLTVGMLFPEFRAGRRWEVRGRGVLEADVRRLIYDDGSFVQHSMNYHRVMLHVCLWAIRLSDANGRPLSDELKRRAGLAGEWLLEMLDPSTGRAPNYGANDGALVLPMTAGEYEDYRPTVQAVRFQATSRRVLDAGPWDEALLWIYGPDALRDSPQPHAPASRRFDAGGYYTLRGKRTWCMIRCHTYRHRPAHVDMLHVDVWHRGVNVLSDSGTYKYYAPQSPGVEKFFKDLTAHNAVQVDDRGPLEAPSRFLWLPWPQARCLDHGRDRFQGEHYAYHREPWNVVHRRTVELESDGSLYVTDDILGEGNHSVTIHWHLADGPCNVDLSALRAESVQPFGRMTLRVEGPQGTRLEMLRGTEEPVPAGWQSTRYGLKTPRPTVMTGATCVLPARFVTRIEFADRLTP